MIYLDNAATSMPKPAAVIEAMAHAAREFASPGRGSSPATQGAEEVLYELRKTAEELFACPMDRVVLTTSATHGLNIAIKSLVSKGDRVVISPMEHNAVVRPLYALGARVFVAEAPLFDGAALLASFDRLLTPDTAACIMTHVSNVFGWELPTLEVAELCRRREIPFVLDASQSAGLLPVSMEQLGAAFIAMPGHKGLQGPQGTGLLLCGHETKTLIEGGTGSVSLQREMPDFLPDRLEAGTPNIPGAAGLLAGLRQLQKEDMSMRLSRERMLCGLLASGLEEMPGIRVFTGSPQAGVLSFVAEGADCVLLGEALSQKGIAQRAGLHCAPLAHETAGTLQTGTVRLSPGPRNTPAEIDAFFNALEDCLKEPAEFM